MTLRGVQGDWESPGRVIDITLAGAGLETEDALTPGDRVTVAFATPTLWDPLVLTAVIAWAHPVAPSNETDPLVRPLLVARAGLAFDYPSADATLAMFDMLVAVGFD